MNEFTRLTRPLQSQVTLDSTAKECSSEGFSYPTFRLVNKQARVTVSSNPLNPIPSIPYRLFAVSNVKGWFTAVTSSSIIFSPLQDLRLAFKSTNNPFSPKRSLSLSHGASPTLIAFASADTKLLVAFDGGQLAVYDTSLLFTPGSENIQPINFLETHAGPFRQIAPNPGTEPAIVDTLAVVRGDGCVQLLNTNLESQGGWAGSDIESTPVAIAWSPKGKHIALGLHSGDILTFLPSSPASPQKHIPPTTSAPLISLTWLAPGHTFRTTYAPAPHSVDPAQHILSLDTKSSILTYAAPNHPFALPDRTQQSFVIVLPRWDEDGTSEKTLLVVADKSSTDIEILGSSSGGWHQQWQENQLALPLDKSTSEDTVLLALDVDLTDSATDGVPVVYAYLNDGTVEGWFVEGTKLYAGMVRSASSGAASSFTQPTPASPFTQPQVASSFAPSTAPAFAQPASTSTFGQSAFGTGSGSSFGTTGFGQTSTFGQTASPSAFGTPFSQPSQPTPFAQPTSTSASGFGAFASAPSAFGGATSASNAFSSSGAGSAFGSDTNNAFGSSSTSSAFNKPSGGAFGSFTSSNTNVFGQTGFGFGSPSPTTSPSPTAPDMSREASMGDDTSFGGLSLSLGDNDTGAGTSESQEQKPGIFGPFAPPVAPTTTTTFGGGAELLKPATGFGAFSNYQGPSGTATTGSDTNTNTATDQKPSSAFGQSSFGQPSFGKPAFGQSAFGQSGFGAKPAVSVPVSTSAAGGGGFSAFAMDGSTGFGGASASAFSSGGGGGGGGGFSAFSSGTPSAFGQQQSGTTSTSPFTSTQESPKPFAPPAPTAPSLPFGTQPQPQPQLQSLPSFRESSPPAKEELTPQTPTKPLALPISPSSSPDTSPFGHGTGTETKIPSTPSASPFGPKASGGGAFGNLVTTPSAFKPASGFGAFGSDLTPTSSPFFKPKPAEAQLPVAAPTSVSVFSSQQPQSQAPPSSTPSATPAFGAPSSLGAFKSVFAPSAPVPVKPPSTGGFGAFSGTTGGFSAFAGQKKSFGELLKAADVDAGEEKEMEKEKEKGDPVKPTTSTVLGATKEKVDEEKVEVKKEEKEDGEIVKDTTVDVKPTAEESKKPPETAAAKSPTPEAITPKIPTKAVAGLDSNKPLAVKAEEEKPSKGLFTSKIPVSVFPSVSTPVFGTISDKGTATPKIEVKEEVASPDSTPKAPVSVFSPPPMDTPSSEHESGKGKSKAVEKQESSVSVSDTSFGHLSLLSEASSFVEVEDEGQGGEDSSSDSDTDGEHGDDLVIGDESSDGSSFLSESYASSDESPEEEPESDEEEDTHSPEPTAIPLPASRSPSATPQPELPAIHVTPSPSDSPEPGMLPTIPEEESTTPPGTPTKEQPPLRKSPSPAPTPTPPLFGVGLGRPSTRPTRSSPLANTPVSLEDNEELVPTPQVVASPKPHFAVLPMPPPSPDKPEAEESNKTSVSKPPLRPRTPPLLLFGSTKPSTTPSSPAPSPSMLPPKAASAPPTAPPFGSLFGKPAPPPVFGVLQNANNKVQAAPAKSPAPSPSPYLPSKSIFPPPITPVATPSFGIFGTPPQGTTPPPQPTPTPAGTGFSLGSFSLKGISATPAPPVPKSLFGSPLPSASKPATPAPPTAPSAPGTPAPHPIASMEEGMQKECAVLILTLNKELEDLRILAQRANERRLELSKSAGGSRKKADLGDSTKWNLGDVVQFGKVLQQYEEDLSSLQELRDAQYRALRELQSNMLKAGTRKEEIIRFNKAKNDSEFAKMLKSRTLGPEHLETQTQLRRSIRAMRDRIQKLEDHLNASKRKLAQVSSGKPGFRAPSLDTINRTYRNIDIALQQQTDEVAQLASRISKLTIKNPGILKSQHPARDARLPDAATSRRPYNVTPHVAVTTAAALNAERFAHELKRALLAARKEPLLNTKAAAAPLPPSGFKSPQKTFPAPNFSGFSTPFKGPLFPTAQESKSHSTPMPVPDWTLPEDNFNPSTPPAARRGAGVAKRQHMSVPLKKSASPAASPPAASFEWGPLPVFEQAQGTTMVEAVRLTPPPSSKSLGGSSFGGWNVGLFEKKEK